MNFFSKKNIYTLSGFQITWLACVFGEYFAFPLFGFIIGIIYLLLFFYFEKNLFYAFKICIFFSIIGYLFDSLLSYNKIYYINSNFMFSIFSK